VLCCSLGNPRQSSHPRRVFPANLTSGGTMSSPLSRIRDGRDPGGRHHSVRRHSRARPDNGDAPLDRCARLPCSSASTFGDVSPNPRKFRRRSNDRRRRAGDRLSRKRCLVISARRHQSPASAWVATADFPEKALCRENSSALEGRRNFLGFGLTSPLWG
jgi:hypothetical protein